MNETGEFFQDFARRHGDTVLAYIRALNSDGTYTCELISGGMVRASSTNATEVYTVNSLVYLSPLSASGKVIGASYVILTRGTKDMRGMSGTTPEEGEEEASSVAVIGIDPEPLVLEAGGEPGVQVITGVGFREEAVYQSEEIEEEDAAIVTSEKVTMSIRATEDAPIGFVDLLIQGIRVEHAIRVIEPPPIPGYVVLAGHKRSFIAPSTFLYTPVAWIVRSDTLELVAAIDPTGTSSNTRRCGGVTVLADGTIIFAWRNTGSNSPDVLQIATNEPANYGPHTPTCHWDYEILRTVDSGNERIAIASTSADSTKRGLWLITPSGSVQTRIFSTDSIFGIAEADQSYVCMGGGSNCYEIWKPQFGSGLRATTALGSAEGVQLHSILPRTWNGSEHGALVGTVIAISGTAVKRFPIGGGAIASLAVPGSGTSANRAWNAVQIGSRIYIIRDTGRAIYWFDPLAFDVMNLLTTLPADVNEYGVALSYRYMTGDGVQYLYVASSDRKIRRVDAYTGEILVGPELWANPNPAQFYQTEAYQMIHIG